MEDTEPHIEISKEELKNLRKKAFLRQKCIDMIQNQELFEKLSLNQWTCLFDELKNMIDGADYQNDTFDKFISDW